ncbi:MAG: hypothetical protein WCB53_02390, partial [Terriglobales bacterium]
MQPSKTSVILSAAERAKQSSAQSKDPYPRRALVRSFKAFSSTAVALLVLLLVATVAAQDHPIALKGARLLTITHGTIENGTVIMQAGKITAVGANISIPTNAQTIDATGMTIYPGLIDSETQLGL